MNKHPGSCGLTVLVLTGCLSAVPGSYDGSSVLQSSRTNDDGCDAERKRLNLESPKEATCAEYEEGFVPQNTLYLAIFAIEKDGEGACAVSVRHKPTMNFLPVIKSVLTTQVTVSPGETSLVSVGKHNNNTYHCTAQ